ncbi:MAG: GNAT family N-acetyltransferase [Planctomycetota bacterium]|jgi:GNAT superfamily N-acetyltransferase
MAAKLITYYLEMKSSGELRCSRNVNPELEVKQVLNPSPELSSFLYSAVGKDWYWTDRLKWSEGQWLEYVDRPELETWVGWVSGQQVGYFELEMQPGANVEIAYFGLLPEFIGQGIGGQLLTAATERAWKMGAGRVWVHTNTRDHPHALSNYEARGFRIFKEEQMYMDLPNGEAGV